MTPASVTNPPNLSALSYRVGTYAGFFESMVARLSQYDLDPLQPLKGLRTRSIDDPSIALLDAWAIVADVLTFYEERIANEGYLPTATERRSIMELAALVGYDLRPGVAASGYLAFMLQDGYDTDVPVGTRAQTLPGPGEEPQPFETGSPLSARSASNDLEPRQTRPQVIEQDKATVIYLSGTATNLKPNDPLLLVFDPGVGKQEFRRVEKVTPEPDFNRTRVEMQASPLRAAIAAVARAVGYVLGRHLDPTKVVSAQSVLGRDVVGIIQKAQAELSLSLELEALIEWLEAVLRRLRARHKVAADRNYTRLQEWIAELIRDLEVVMAALPPAGAMPPRPRATEPAPVSSPLASLDALLVALAKPASVPPAGASELGLTPGQVFAQGSDQVVEFLTALKPAAGSPYRALANAAVTAQSPVKVYALRTTAQLFGHAAPKRLIFETGVYVEWPVIEYPKGTTRSTLHEHPDVIDLDGSHPEVLESSWIVVSTRKTPLTRAAKLIARVASVASLSRADYGISGTITRIELEPGGWTQLDKDVSEYESAESERIESEDELDEQDDFNAIRWTEVYAQSELLPQAEAPIQDDVKGDVIELGRLHDGLQPGRWLIVTGERTDIPNTTVPGGELVMLSQVEQSFDSKLPGDRMHSTLHLANGLAFQYARGSATVYGNVVPATEGETHQEVLGSGDGSRPSQEFTLRHPFLAYVPARNAKGMVSTLAVHVDGIPWQQVKSLARLGPRDHGFATRTSDDGKTTVIFGDGHHGARLPSGSENVVAVYRSRTGTAFDSPPGKISLLATKPLGVKSVVNPLSVAPGSGPESRDSGRRNAPLGVAPLDRLVSVHDYEEFSLGFGGVGKASANELWDGRHHIVHVTVAGMDSGQLPADSQMLQSLETALQLSGDRAQPVQVAPREFLFLVISANVALAPGFSWDTVSEAIRQRLLGRFGFDAREFAQDVVSSDVISAVQSVAGVQSVQLVILDAVPETITAAQLAVLGTQLGLRQRIHARLARLAPTRDRILPAQVCVLNPNLKGTLLLTKVTG